MAVAVAIPVLVPLQSTSVFVPLAVKLPQGITVTASELEAPFSQKLPGVTVIVPDVTPNVIVIDVVFCPLLIVAPDGTVQSYLVAPVTGVMVYVTDEPSQTDTGPVIGPAGEGVGGSFKI